MAALQAGARALRAWGRPLPEPENVRARRQHIMRVTALRTQPRIAQDPAPARVKSKARDPLQLKLDRLMASAVDLFRTNLRATPDAIRYLAERGIGGAIAGRYGLGYALPGWRELGALLDQADADLVDASGLTARSANKPDAAPFDRFRHRIMFPVRSMDGQVAGFGGRTLEGGTDAPKYLNSPESARFKKRELVYGLFEAQQAIREAGEALVVEGYFDVLTPVQAGMANVVGTLGTACTAQQVKQLLAVAGRVVFCFDGDKAGQQAAERVLDVVGQVLRPGVSFGFVMLPADEDPDTLVRAHGVDALRDLVRRAKPLPEHVIDVALDGCDLSLAEGRARLIARTRDLIARLPDEQLQLDVASRCAGLVGMTPEGLRSCW